MKNVVLNSILVFIAAYLLSIILHELAHFIMAVSLGYDATLFHNRVTYDGRDNTLHEVLIAGSGPLYSLVQGIVSLFLLRRMSASATSLFVLWFSVIGFISFFGYLMIAPFIPFGDTERVFNLLEFPFFLQIIIAIIAVITITIILMRFVTSFEQFVSIQFQTIKETRFKWANSLILIPLIVGIIVITILQFPIPHFASILATTCAPFSIMATYGSMLGRRDPINTSSSKPHLHEKVSVLLIILLIVSIVLNRLLVQGL